MVAGGEGRGGGLQATHIKQGEVMLKLQIYHSRRGVEMPSLVKCDCEA